MCTYNNGIEILQDYTDSGCKHFIFSLYSFNDEKDASMEEFHENEGKRLFVILMVSNNINKFIC